MTTLIIIDLNGIIVKTHGKGKFSVRPNLDYFVNELTKLIRQNIIKIAFWTSKPEENGRAIFEIVIGGTLWKHALFTWYRDECTPIVIDNNPFHTQKDLRKVWSQYSEYNESNTFLLDDSPSKCGDYPNNLIHAPSYLGPRKAPNDNGFKSMIKMIHQQIDKTM